MLKRSPLAIDLFSQMFIFWVWIKYEFIHKVKLNGRQKRVMGKGVQRFKSMLSSNLAMKGILNVNCSQN